MNEFGEDEVEDFGLFRGLLTVFVVDVIIVLAVGWVMCVVVN